jgi:hypothetical protein
LPCDWILTISSPLSGWLGAVGSGPKEPWSSPINPEEDPRDHQRECSLVRVSLPVRQPMAWPRLTAPSPRPGELEGARLGLERGRGPGGDVPRASQAAGLLRVGHLRVESAPAAAGPAAGHHCQWQATGRLARPQEPAGSHRGCRPRSSHVTASDPRPGAGPPSQWHRHWLASAPLPASRPIHRDRDNFQVERGHVTLAVTPSRTPAAVHTARGLSLVHWQATARARCCPAAAGWA